MIRRPQSPLNRRGWGVHRAPAATPPPEWVDSPLVAIEPDAEGDPQQYDFQSADAEGDFTAWLRFPAGYDPDSGAWPTYWVLHGHGASAATVIASWLVQFDAAVLAGTCPDGIVVIPDFGLDHWYVDSLDGTSLKRTALNVLDARIAACTRASADRTLWNLAGMSMGFFGAADWFADDPTAWGSFVGYGGANLDATTGNNWGTSDADDITTYFGDNQSFLESWSPAQTWVTNAAAIIAADRPIRIVLGSSDNVVDDSMIAFRAAIDATAIRYADDTATGATHSFASYMTADTTEGPKWHGAAQYVFHTDPLCHGVVNARYTQCYTESGGNVTSLINRVTSASFTSGTMPAFSATGLNGRPCFDFNGTTHHVFGTDATWTAEISGSDLPFTELWVVDLDAIDATQIYGGYSNTGTNEHVGTGTNTTGNGRTRHQKIDSLAGAKTAAGEAAKAATAAAAARARLAKRASTTPK